MSELSEAREAVRDGNKSIDALLDVLDENERLREALKRAVVLMKATRQLIEKHPIEDYVIFYDEAECDASCLSDDCNFAIDEAEDALKEATPEK